MYSARYILKMLCPPQLFDPSVKSKPPAKAAPKQPNVSDAKQGQGEAPVGESKTSTPPSLAKLGFSLSYRIPFAEVKKGEPLGDGYSAKVYQGSWRGMTVAVKEFNFTSVNSPDYPHFLTECEFMADLQKSRLPCVIEYAGYAISPDKKSFNMVMEYLPKGEVFSMIATYLKQGQHTPWATCYEILENTARAIEQFHAAGFVHADLNFANVMLTENNGVKLIDFGHSFKLPPGIKSKILPKRVGTSSYMAPETITYNTCGYAADIFAFGSMIYVIAEQAVPLAYADWDEKRIIDFVAKGGRQGLSKDCPEGLAKLIKWCWKPIPDDRPSATQLRVELHKLALENKGPSV